ncbi:corepressor interacting with RBPJ 1-like [Dendronephthya gigantea]|uniref:corepressor interacting with RBPJ 1-like n=1 Tax=Dendronephthya gigantea TaxID=151771 RepID=UPI00106AC3DF|nr:corepressor interacting with RBPJ 1-like [Dendronephthya gigantea]
MFQKFMNKKDFHPGSKWNIKRVWMAEQKKAADEHKQAELTEQYKKEQDKFENRQLVSKDEKLKLGLSFVYDAPPGFKDKKKEGEELSKPKEEEEVKFEWLKGAPKEGYTKDLNLETHAQPFGIPVRNVRCIKCHKWGHVNTDRECPLYNKSISTEPSSLTDANISDPVKLMQEMRNDGFALKQNALGRVLNKNDPNQQILASDEDDADDDPELAFLATLNEKQKRKLLRKLDKLESKEQEKEKRKSKKKRKHSDSESEKDSKSKRRKKRKQDLSRSESSDDGHSKKKKRKQEKNKRDKTEKDRRDNRSVSNKYQEDRSHKKR